MNESLVIKHFTTPLGYQSASQQKEDRLINDDRCQNTYIFHLQDLCVEFLKNKNILLKEKQSLAPVIFTKSYGV